MTNLAIAAAVLCGTVAFVLFLVVIIASLDKSFTNFLERKKK
jgi:hypothetical protein